MRLICVTHASAGEPINPISAAISYYMLDIRRNNITPDSFNLERCFKIRTMIFCRLTDISQLVLILLGRLFTSAIYQSACGTHRSTKQVAQWTIMDHGHRWYN